MVHGRPSDGVTLLGACSDGYGVKRSLVASAGVVLRVSPPSVLLARPRSRGRQALPPPRQSVIVYAPGTPIDRNDLPPTAPAAVDAVRIWRDVPGVQVVAISLGSNDAGLNQP